MYGRARRAPWGALLTTLILPFTTTPLSAQGVWMATQSHLGIQRDAHASLLVEGRVLIIGGRTKAIGATTRKVESYDPASGAITEIHGLIRSRSFFAPVLLENGKVLVPGGYRQPNKHGTIDDCELFDPIRERWKKTGRMHAPRELYTATRLPDGTVLIAAGFSNGDIEASAERYDPDKSRFRPAGNLQTARFGHTATLLGERVLITGGRTVKDVSLKSTEIYSPSEDAWSPGPPMQADRFRHTATLLKDGRILLTGGYSSTQGKTLASAEIYDPATGTFTLLSSPMSDTRMDHTATLLNDGRVLIVGGWSSVKGRTVASADLYDPATNAFTPAAPLPVSRHEHTATLLPDGTVLVTGGLRHEPATQGTLNDAYLYRP